MDCRIGCAACCIVISISSPIPGMPEGKPAGVPCVQLTADGRCGLFSKPERPAVCRGLTPSADMCGATSEEAFAILEVLEQATAPSPRSKPTRDAH
ncbi:YkgJ family cysteine cluster protein [Paenibacillus allorhizosphaerae]|uniref:YkgJ family cysteine cluster protein n=1 Tax=Paenibacillus allorhizosphaerae TaxID=2849866 RepID=UPI001C403118|nr:YkgJ family cysteine cluster protein [Paenibacillus allorhizosphaerae]